ncbi:hypothetical protein HYW19_03775 [Candidatus Woesearchaeota archaeon]|nr:hypothetical protein [Candidatus Woesearchaeota archaeon]
MESAVRNDALQIISRVIEILETKGEKDATELNELSNNTIHNASVFQDGCSVSIAVLIYALSKIIQRNPEFDYNGVLNLLKEARDNLENDKEDDFHATIKKLFSEISRLDSKIRIYVQKVINQAQIKKGSKLCEHGLSCAKASHILGISQWELMNYIGKTNLAENAPQIIGARARLKFARSLFA